VNVRTVERWEKAEGLYDKRKNAVHSPMNKLTEEQRQMVLSIANRSNYQNLPPCQIVPMLADEGIYMASESTFYRILRDENQLAHRQSNQPAQTKPKAYSASHPNQVWTWDITYLATQVLGCFFYLYLIIDIFSRKIVGWSVHDVQLSDYAAKLIKQACLDEHITRDQIVLHSDNGKTMKGMTMLAMLEKLGVIPSFSRPSVSDDNPYSEALFRTLKYHPTFPMFTKFATMNDARNWCEQFVTWYNQQHLHSALKFVTPEQRHNGEDIIIRQKRHLVYELAKKQQPQRWSGKTRDWSLPTIVTLNPDKKLTADSQKLNDFLEEPLSTII
jgi:putative transposase